MNTFTQMIQGILDVLAFVLNMLLSVFPPSPFRAALALSVDNEMLQFINWLVPIPQIVALLQVWITGIGVYYGYSVIARFVKLMG